MADSDEEFARFLEAEDSASASSASPVKLKRSSSARSSSGKGGTTSRDRPKTSNKSNSSRSRGSKATTGSRSALSGSNAAMAAAEKLLATSGRGKKKPTAKAIAEDDEDDDDGPPPSYSAADPYAFDLESSFNWGGRHGEGKEPDDEDPNAEDDEDADADGGARGRGSKESKLKKASKKEKITIKPEKAPQKREAKTLEERVAEILKRTGSSAFVDTEVASADDHELDEQKDEELGESRISGDRDFSLDPPIGGSESASKGNAHAEGGTDLYDEPGSGVRRLSLSDSLGMESADFEVGVLAKRKLDRSRLSLSSLNSEKFAVNINALEESEQANSRYDSIPRSTDGMEGESDYADDGFELDHTTVVDEKHAAIGTPQINVPPSSHNESDYVSEFETMKELLRLDTVLQSGRGDHQSETQFEVPVAPLHHVESETFGYDEEDFEADEEESKEDAYAGGRHDRSIPSDNSSGHHEPQNELSAINEPSLSSEDAIINQPSQVHTELPLHPPLIAGFVPSDVESPPNDGDHHSTQLSADEGERRILQSPPPPPPPPEEEEIDHLQLQQVPDNPKNIANSANTNAGLVIERPPENLFTRIDRQVSALRLISSPRRKSTALIDSDPHEATPVDGEFDEELKEIEHLVEITQKKREFRRNSRVVRSSTSKENDLTLRLQQAQRQILKVKQHLRHLAEDNDEETSDMNEKNDCVSSSQDPDVAHPEQTEYNAPPEQQERYAYLEKEIQTQDRLIQGYQRENEQLMHQLKTLRKDVKYDVHQENLSLKQQLRELRNLLDANQRSIGSNTTIHDALDARLRAEAHAEALEEELKSVKVQHQEKMQELKVELDKVKKSKLDMECQYEGVDIVKLNAESRELRNLRQKLQEQQSQYEHLIAGLQKKLDWYVSNQRLLDAQDQKIETLKAENKRLAAQVGKVDRQRSDDVEDSNHKGPKVQIRSRHPGDVRRIQELESRLSEMEDTIRKRNPDSLVSLIVASRKANDESTMLEVQERYSKRIEELETELQEQSSSSERRLSAFRQQQERLVLQYKKTIESLEQKLARSQMPSRMSTGKFKRAAPSELESTKIRHFYKEKIKELERRWETKFRMMRKQTSNSDSKNPQESISSSEAARVISALRRELKTREAQLTQLRTASSSSTARDGEMKERVESLERQLRLSEDARKQLTDTIQTLQSLNPQHSKLTPDILEKARKEIEKAANQRFDEELLRARSAFESTIASQDEKVSTLQRQVDEQTATNQELLTELTRQRQKLEQLQLSLKSAEKENQVHVGEQTRIAELENEVSRLRHVAAIPMTPTMLQFRSLELRVETLTQKYKIREAELKELLVQASRSNQIEKLAWERMHQQAIALKNAEIRQFKKQLDEIMAELENLQDND